MRASEAKRISDSKNTLEKLKQLIINSVGEEYKKDTNQYPNYFVCVQHLTTEQITWLAENGYRIDEDTERKRIYLERFVISWN